MRDGLVKENQRKIIKVVSGLRLSIRREVYIEKAHIIVYLSKISK